ncbi:MAG: WG repeat-containing protein [Chitinophagales bacterium]
MKKIYCIIIFLLINSIFAHIYAQKDYAFLAPVKKSGKWGYINIEGEYIIYPKFQMAGDFAESVAAVKINGLWGFVDANGKYVIKPQFDDAYSFSKGLARAKQQNHWGFIDNNGKFVIKPLFEQANDFVDGLALVMKGGKYGYINTEGKLVIPAQFDDAFDFSEGFALVLNENGQWGYITTENHLIDLPNNKEASSFFSESLSVVQTENNKYGYVGENGAFVIQPQFDDASHFSENLAAVAVDKKYGFINKKGKYVIKTVYENAAYFSENLAAVKSGDKYGYIDTQGNWIVAPQFDDAQPFLDGLAKIEIAGLFGFINSKGQTVIEPQYTWAFDFSEGLAAVEWKGAFGYINKNGMNIIAPQFEDLGSFKKVAAPTNMSTKPTISFSEHMQTTTVVQEKAFLLQAEIESKTELLDYMILINDHLYNTKDSNTKGNNTKPINKTKNGTYSLHIEALVPLNIGLNKIYLTATNAHGKAQSEVKEIVYENNLEKPNLYILAVGISKFESSEYNINYADKDADDFSNAFEQQKSLSREKQLYNDIIIKKLTNELATKQNIQKAIMEIKRLVTRKDLFILHISSHGEIDNTNDYYIRTYDTDSDKQFLSITALSNKWLVSQIKDFDCTVMQFFDTCHSGKGGDDLSAMKSGRNNMNIETAIVELKEALKSKAVYFFASSGKQQLSQENKHWKNGAFTEAILDCFAEKKQQTLHGQDIMADANQDGYINTTELDNYVSKVVKTITNGLQSPKTTIENGEPINLFVLD